MNSSKVPKSRITLRYPCVINGVKKMQELPLRLLIMGDLSCGSSNDRKLPLEERETHMVKKGNINQLINAMNINLSVNVANTIDPHKGSNMEINMPIISLESFTPKALAENIPKVKGLLLIKKLLLELQSVIDNKKEFRNLLCAILQDKDKKAALLQSLDQYQSFKLPVVEK